MSLKNYKNLTVKVYHGYGHAARLIIFGHVLRNSPAYNDNFSKGIFKNFLRLLQLFLVKPVPKVTVSIMSGENKLTTETASDGFFKFEWEMEDVDAGWHEVTVNCEDKEGNIITTGIGSLFVPHITQYAFISDIDDTVLMSYSATIIRRLKTLLFKNPSTRKSFPEVTDHYQQLALSHTTPDISNPFFYVSSSEWNLYDDIIHFFRLQKLPEGVLLLNQLKRWFELIKTGKTKHDGKLIRIVRILETFPNQQFILLGDNSQKDPFIYQSVAEKYRNNIFAVYIRNIRSSRKNITNTILEDLETKGILTCQYENSYQSIQHSIENGLIDNDFIQKKRMSER